MIEHNYGAGTQRAMILADLLDGRKVDWLQCYHLCGSSKASTRVGEIERATGLPIARSWVKFKNVKFKQYWIDFDKMTKAQKKKYGVK